MYVHPSIRFRGVSDVSFFANALASSIDLIAACVVWRDAFFGEKHANEAVHQRVKNGLDWLIRWERIIKAPSFLRERRNTTRQLRSIARNRQPLNVGLRTNSRQTPPMRGF